MKRLLVMGMLVLLLVGCGGREPTATDLLAKLLTIFSMPPCVPIRALFRYISIFIVLSKLLSAIYCFKMTGNGLFVNVKSRISGKVKKPPEGEAEQKMFVFDNIKLYF